jgi:hypothetical protein
MYADRLHKASSNIPGQTTKLILDVVGSVAKEVVLATPVKTGRARVNWQLGISEPVTTLKYWPAPSKPVSVESATQEAVGAIETALMAYRWPRSFFFSNGLPYIEFLNNGSSDQAPAGFVERAMIIARERIQGSRIKIIDLNW